MHNNPILQISASGFAIKDLALPKHFFPMHQLLKSVPPACSALLYSFVNES